MKAILISIKPEWVFKILNKEKTIEIRRTMPKCNLPIDVYIYCTKAKTELYGTDKGFVLTDFGIGDYFKNKKICNGKVVAKFTLNKVEGIKYNLAPSEEYFFYTNEDNKIDSSLTLNEESCLNDNELEDYLGIGFDIRGYAWHISDLVIFDKPKELSEFKQPRDSYGKVNWNTNEYYYMELANAPQSFMYVEETFHDEKAN